MSFKARRLGEASVEPFRWEPVRSRDGSPVFGTPPNQPPDPEVQQRIASQEREAFAKGYQQGERAGAEAAATRAEGMLKRLAQTVDELGGVRGEIIRRTERQMIQLVLAIAERIVQRELSLDRSLLPGMARAALDRLGEYGSATIRLHPEDFAAIGGRATAEGPVRVVADAVVPRGGCLVQSDFGFMDASPEAQFREMTRALLSEMDAPSADGDATHGIVLK
jgi:flagellar assembly protein FliH